MNNLNILDLVQYRILKYLYPKSPGLLSESHSDSKLSLLGGALSRIPGSIVIDFGCGKGYESVAMAKLGAKKVIGLDIQEVHLDDAKKHALNMGVSDQCTFATSTTELADMIVSIDAFEHFDDPASILDTMHGLLKPGGIAIISFGPTWYHPLGGHTFSVFPWAHLLFSEKSLIKWRSGFKSDGATKFSEVAGGLNQMTISKFKKFVNDSKLNIVNLERIPIMKLRRFNNRMTQEFTTALVRGVLCKKEDMPERI